MRTIVGMLALLSVVIVVPGGYAADKEAPAPVAQKVLSPGEKLSREEAAADQNATEKDIEKAAAEAEQQRVDAEDLLSVERAQRETDQIRQQLQDEITKAQQETEREAEQVRKAQEEELAKALQEVVRQAEEEAKQLDRELQKIKVSPPAPR